MEYAADRAIHIGKRTEQRFPIRIAAVIWSGNEHVFGTIEDISATGAKIHTEFACKLGARVTIRGVAMDQAGSIVWRKGQKCGVRFDEAVNPLEIVRRNMLLHENRLARLIRRSRSGPSVHTLGKG